MAHLLDCKWHFDTARRKHQQALRASPDDVLTYFHYGLHLLATDAPHEAVAAFASARELNPFSPNLSVMLARAASLASGDPATQSHKPAQLTPPIQAVHKPICIC
ncbi:MAG: hypothetical protein ABI171_00365 [Collimonas sp.]|uniref:hypothetical protein n=1 Tax=Collimonas sp. TaxID=1963772 RepID=UPI0032672DD2